MHDVELAGPVGQQPGDAHGERTRFGKARGPHGGQLQQVDRITDLAGAWHPERVRLPVEVEAGYLGQPHPRIEQLGIRLAGEDLHFVAEIHQTAAEMPHINTLPAAVVLTPVGQQSYSHTRPFAASDPPRKGAKTVAVNGPANTATANWTCVQMIVR